MNNFNACTKQERLSKQTLLALLDSNQDYSKGIIAQTGSLIDFTEIMAPILLALVEQKVSENIWGYYQEGLKPSFRIKTNVDLVDDNMTKLYVLVDPYSPVPLPRLESSQTTVLNSPEGKAAFRNNVLKYINNRTWLYYEQSMPKRILLTNPNWTIDSFDSRSRNVCVTMNANSGYRNLNFTLNNFVTS